MSNIKIKCKNFVYNYFYKYKFLNTVEKRKLIKNNVKFKNAHYGERCFIVGNGPSIKGQDLSKLSNEYTFMVNQAMRMPIYNAIKPQFHILADPRYYNLNNKLEEDREVIELIKSLSTNPELICFFPINAFEFVRQNNLDDKLNISYFMAANTFYEGIKKEINLAKTIYASPTVIQFGIQIALYMGFSDIYLLGCDMTGFEEIRNVDNSMQSAYAYQLTENEKKRMLRSTMHNGEELFYAYARNYTIYRIMNSYCTKRSVNLYNATKGGLLDNLKRVEFDYLF